MRRLKVECSVRMSDGKTSVYFDLLVKAECLITLGIAIRLICQKGLKWRMTGTSQDENAHGHNIVASAEHDLLIVINGLTHPLTFAPIS